MEEEEELRGGWLFKSNVGQSAAGGGTIGLSEHTPPVSFSLRLSLSHLPLLFHPPFPCPSLFTPTKREWFQSWPFKWVLSSARQLIPHMERRSQRAMKHSDTIER